MAARLTKKEHDRLQARINRIARTCVNYDTDHCTLSPRGIKCAVTIPVDVGRLGKTNLCPYFVRSLLPSDPATERAYHEQMEDSNPLKKFSITDNDRVAKCATCSASFIKRSNAQKYCKSCSAERRRKKEAERMRERRYKEKYGS